MTKFYRLLTVALLLAGGNAAAQSATGPLQAIQSINLGAHGSLGGTVVLPNHNTVLLLTDADAPGVRAQCLAPNGRTVWEANLDRFQRQQRPDFSVFNPLGNVVIGRGNKQSKQEEEAIAAASLLPVSVLTAGNQVILVERIYGDAIKKQAKGGPLKDGQVSVQRIDEQGHVSKVFFEPRPEPESKKTDAETLGRYADANGYVEIVRETNKREETLVFCTMHYDLNSKEVRREKLELPETPKHVGGMSTFRHWYQEWAYLGHRSNQTYFCRRTLTSTPKERPGFQPLNYQVFVADDLGAPAGGFTTTLNLRKGTLGLYSGTIPSFGELNHIPLDYSVKSGNSYITMDEWDTSTGGMGSFYLDYATGDVILFGEYGKGERLTVDFGPDLLGYFQQRYTASGTLVNQLQQDYSEAMRAKKKKASFRAGLYRHCRFHYDPLNAQSQFSFSPLRYYGNSEDFDLFIDRDLKPLRYEYLPGKDKDERIYTNVWFAEPFWLYKSIGTSRNLRTFEHAAPSDLPVYAALEKLRRASGLDAEYHGFYLSATGAGKGLVVERKQALGGNLQVYTF